jgi:hypothetical protein
VTSAAKAVAENKTVIAAVNRCATQNQVQHQFFRCLLNGRLISETLRYRSSGALT